MNDCGGENWASDCSGWDCCNWRQLSSSASEPGLTASARTAPTIAAKREHRRYQLIVLRPTRPNLFMGRLAAPVMREKKMTGMTIIFNMLTKTRPKGEMYLIAV